MNNTIGSQLISFLDSCKQSNEKTITNLTDLLPTIENPITQREGAVLLKKIVESVSTLGEKEALEKYHFHFFQMEVPNGLNESFSLTLLQLPSTFAPEEWSYTFFEGISRYSKSEFLNKKMVELGCGNGWISLSVAKKFNCSMIYGFDINPKAILCSKLNLYINAFDTDGNLIVEEDGKSLLDKVQFEVSDLLSYCFENKINDFDAIIGCIPQVLAPEEAIDINKINENANDEFLHSLSNYTSEQGYVEDKFGLGLIARSVEESIDLLKPDGKLILNLGERPRREVLERLVKRRGLLINRIWKRKVCQADDTDIDSLVRLEKEMNHHFEFYTDIHSEIPINARTAKLYASNGGTIYHNLSVYECTFDYYSETKLLFDELKNELFSEAKVGLDLDYVDRHQKEEKIRFLAELVRDLRTTNHFPYNDNQGEISFRKQIASFLNAYHHVHFSEKNILVTPNLASLVENIVDTYHPNTIFLSEELFDSFNLLQQENRSICTPNCSKELIDLIRIIKPQVVIAKIIDDTLFTYESIKKMCTVCQDSNTRLFIDISDSFELSSSPESNGIFQYLNKHELPLHVSIICELSKNQIYKDLKTCFMVSSNETVLTNLRNAAEFSYSRSPYLSQFYYSTLLKELTNFHMNEARKLNVSSELEVESDSDKFVQLPESVSKAFNHASIKGNEYKIDKNTIRFDYGENELACPDDLKISILESFTRQNISSEELNPDQQIQLFLENRFGLSKANQLCYGNGVAPLFTAILKFIKEENGTILFPQGAYGYFYATACFYGVNIIEIHTKLEDSFLLNKTSLESTLLTVERPWLFLNFPLVNPTGRIISNQLLDDLFSAKGMEKTRCIIDTVFSGLEFDTKIDLKGLEKWQNKIKYILLGGISKEYSAGGIRFGFTSSNFTNNLASKITFTPHSTVLYTVNKLFSKYNENSDRIQVSLNTQINILRERAIELTTLLEKKEWTVLKPEGGLFLVASPTGLLGKKISLKNSSDIITLDATNVSEVLFNVCNLLINNQDWTGIPGYCRFVLSIEESDFREGMERLEKFTI